MKFVKAPDDNEASLTNCMISENALVRIGVWRVAFGYRVRAGFLADRYGVTLDWCGGNNWKDVERLYSLAIACLSKMEENLDCFEKLPPHSNIKPFYNDLRFVKTVGELAGDFELISLEQPFCNPLSPLSVQNLSVV